MIQVKTFVFNPVQVNTYLIFDETKEAALIDCGCSNPAEEAQLLDFVKKNELELKLLLNTHLHYDHAWGNAFAAKAFGINPKADAKELKQMPSPASQLKAFGMPAMFSDTKVDTIAAGEILKFGNTTIEVMAVPGHAPGHLAFYLPQYAKVFVGDTLFAGDVGRTDLWGGSWDELRASVEQQLFALPEETIVYTGHGPATSIKHEKNNNPYFL